ncbi:MAG: hypothetical protein ACI4N3_04685 [Alphaproteobacteria bacterium]
MKKITILFLAFGIFVIGFTKMSLSITKPATRRSAKSVRRSATNQSAQKARAATTRSATNARVASTRRAGGVSARRVARNRNATKLGGANSSQTNTNACPIGVVIKRVIDENGKETLYSSKETTCEEPENTIGTSNLDNMSLPGWIAGKYAYVLNCNYGFVKYINDGVYSCVDQNTICPLNTTIKYQDNKYYNPYTDQECKLPAYASALKLNEQLNTNGNIATDNAYYSHCNKNYYRISDAECKACPTGTYTVGTTIRPESITDENGKVTGTKYYLVGEALSESDCYTLDEIQSIKWEGGNMIFGGEATSGVSHRVVNYAN